MSYVELPVLGMIPLGFAGSIRGFGFVMGGRVDEGRARLGAVPLSPEGGIGLFWRGGATCVCGIGVEAGWVPGREVGVYSVVWLAVGTGAAGQLGRVT